MKGARTQASADPAPAHAQNSDGDLAERVDALSVRLLQRSPDELAVIDYVLSGLEYGATLYGPLDLSKDDRDWRREGAQEARDLLIYDAARFIAAYRRGK